MKLFAIIFFTLFTFVACDNAKIATNTISENEKLITQYFEHFNKHDFVKMASMYVDIADFKDPTLGQGIVKQTRQQTIEKYTALATIFPDLHDQVQHIYPSGDKHIIVEFVSSGTGPDKVKFELPICVIFTIENGLIIKDFTYFDNSEEPKS
jgi:ketosteroid isomerase-like protein